MKLYINIFLLNFIFSVFTENLQENENEEIPEFFDSRENWPNCIPKIYNQGTCGACYAMSTATTFSTRFCIRNNKSKIINFSPQNLINCLSGCKGEFPDTVWNYINEKGITTDNCLSYKNSQKSCITKCDSKNIKFKTYLSGKLKFLEDEISIKKEIMTNGPVTSMMYLYKDYYDYSSGIYSHTDGDNYLGFHAISIIGWGVENKIKYWIVQDSYGTSRGENGYMRIKIGDGSGAGQTAFCDEMEGKYTDYDDEEEENYNNNTNNNDTNYNRQKILYINIYFLLLSIIFLII